MTPHLPYPPAPDTVAKLTVAHSSGKALPLRSLLASAMFGAALLCAPPLALAQNLGPAPDASPAVDCFFQWAESQYPTLYTPAGGRSKIQDGLFFRDYAGGVRLAAGSGRVWVLAPGATQLAHAGTVQDWLRTSTCASADTTPPSVLYTSSSANAVDVPLNAQIAAAFSEPIEVTGDLNEALVITRQDGQRVAGTVRYEDDSARLIFTPRGDFDSGRSYLVTVSSAVRDLAGNSLAQAHTWEFETSHSKRRFNEQQQALQWMFDRALWRYNIPGGTMAVVDADGTVWTTASGYSDLTTREPMTVDRMFRIGSNTKPFVASAVLRLVDAGLVRLDAPINTYLGDYMQNYLSGYDGNRITVRNLLNHTSGLFNFTADPVWGDAFLSDPTKRYFQQELLLLSNQHAGKPYVPPVGQFNYSNTNYVLLGLLLGRVGPQVYDETIRTQFLEPLGLTSTLVPAVGDAVPPALTARGYWQDSETSTFHDVTIKDPSMTWSSGDMISDIRDLARWGQALGRGEFLNPATRNERNTFVDMSPNLQSGLGLVRDRRNNMLGHQGGIIGYTSQTYYVVDQDASVAFFYNRTLSMGDYSHVMTYDALSILWPDSYPAGMARSLALPDANSPAGTDAQPAARAAGLSSEHPQGLPGVLNEY